MREQATTADLGALALRRRVAIGMRQPENWVQLVRFSAVGASGYVVNLLVFWLAFHVAGADHRAAAAAAFAVAVSNNFLWNRSWTFRAAVGRARFQAPRFLAVSLAAFAVAFALLELLVVAGLPELVAQAVAIACATPLNFLGNRLWSFRR
jgi:dolichol-phosphate mannosyltransferase